MASAVASSADDHETEGSLSSSMAHREVHYEVLVKRGARWIIDAICKDRDIAIREARNTLQLGQCDGVRVTKEVVNTLTDAAASLTVFERLVEKHELKPSLFDEPRKDEPTSPAEIDRSWIDHKAAALGGTSRQGSRKKDDDLWRMVAASVIGFFGLVTAMAVLLALFA